MQSTASDIPLKTYRVRLDLPGQTTLDHHTIKAVSLDAALEWAEEELDKVQAQRGEWGSLYDISQLD